MNRLNNNTRYNNNIRGLFYSFTSKHPTIARVSLAALAVLLSPLVLPILTISSTALFCRGIFLGYDASETLKKVKGLYGAIIDIIAPYPHDMAKHAFKEGRCGNAELKYEGDVPVLTLKAYKNCINPSKQIGFDYGYLLGIPLQQFLSKWDSLLWVIFPSPAKLPKLCEKTQRQNTNTIS